MSSEIIYHMVGMVLPRAMTGHTEDLVLIAAQMGCSRTTSSVAGTHDVFATGTRSTLAPQTRCSLM